MNRDTFRAQIVAVCAGALLACSAAAHAAPPADSTATAAVSAVNTSAPPASLTAPAGSLSGPGHWFYDHRPYGSEALIHPLRLIFNGGFGTLQFDNRSNRLQDVRFVHGWRRMWADLSRPTQTIEIEGWKEFLRSEVLPVSVSRKTAQYWPNYTLHLIGGGMSTVMMREWFEQHGYRHAALGAGVTITAYHVLNEVVEAGARDEPSTDAIADLMLFDPAGAWLFSHEGVDGFFSRRLHLRDWSAQPAIDPTTGKVENNGQNFSIKLALPYTERWSLFYYFGNHGEAGLSYRFADGSAISAGAGMSAHELVDLAKGSETADLVPSGGVFYDRNGSLLFSIMTAKNSRDGVRVNAYPGMLRIHGWTAGVFVLRVRDGGTVAGLHVLRLPVGVAGRL